MNFNNKKKIFFLKINLNFFNIKTILFININQNIDI